ncbi:MAG: winged helix-turn-helix domain-containing protein [Absicoccus porci]|mgnify:CR=1 FL=1|nr:winged helix-turn-helix domain-containing protein [Absicoccus porci]MCI6087231.1 winged helix-turn-helix domain-containing protein [Absicoccus porci]MDD6459970.1 winged helix-turn-helix domain-containing protein [Absicoccus porci]MDD7329916.1 winged helix-turn-helix domain-containing protein [Absicoccus porci]MDY4737842.1 winged helix-turn-helix domain-containing protein [Absicoccus porci]MEE1355618.1 winged helix-turn-helix domain-containing protein [Absicoccus porci]
MTKSIKINSRVLVDYLDHNHLSMPKDGEYIINEDDFANLLRHYNEDVLRAYFANGAPLEYRYFESNGLIYDRLNKVVTIDHKEIVCTPSELLLLEAFLQNANIVLTRDVLIDLLSHSKTAIQDNTLSVFIMGLRKKVGKTRIGVRKGIGYYWIGTVNKRK